MPRDPPPSTRRTIYSVIIVSLVAFAVFRLNLYIKYPKMAGLKAGDKFPNGVVFSYVPWTDEKSEATACGRPIDLKASEEWKDKKVVLFAVPGAFTPTCAEKHLPSYISNIKTFKEKGVDVIACIAANDAFVMSAFGKVNGVTGDDILFMNDPEVKFSSSIGWLRGERNTERYALVIDKGVVTYAGKEPGRDVTVSSAESVLATL